MELFYILLVLLVITRAFGALAVRVGQPELVGQLISGIVLGVIVGQFADRLPVLSHLADDEVFIALTELGVFFLMLLGGVEMHPAKLVKASRSAVFVAVGGMVVPLAAGLALGWVAIPASPYKAGQTLFLGVAMAITAVPVAVKILLDFGKLESKVGQTIVSAAVIDDILSLVLLAVLTAVVRTGEAPDLAHVLLLAGKVAVFFVFVIAVGRFVGPWVGAQLSRSRLKELELTALLIGACAFAVVAELLGAIPGFVIALIAIAFLGKLLGAGLVARMTGLDTRESTAVGCAMSVRGAVELIIAGIALKAGLFDHPDPTPPIIEHMFSAVVIMAVVTTLVPPIALRYLLGDDSTPEGKVASQG